MAALPEKAVRKHVELAPECLAWGEEVLRTGAPLDRSLTQMFRDHHEYGSRDRRFISDLVFSWFRWRGWLGDARTEEKISLNGGLAYLLDATEPHASASALIAFGTNSKDADTPMGHLSLKEKAERVAKILGRETPLGIRDLAPVWLEEVLYLDDVMSFETIMDSMQTRPPIWVRYTPDKKSTATLPSDVLRQPEIPEAVGFLHSRDLNTFKASPGVSIDIQDLASQVVGHLCTPGSGERWWDTCCGSGGKSIHLAELADNEIQIDATDSRKESIRALRKRLKQSVAGCVKGFNLDASKKTPNSEDYDGVLIDAPCSGIGTWARNADMRWRTRRADVRDSVKIQNQIVDNASTKVKRGGKLVYAVCTLAREETVEVIDRFLKEHPEFIPALDQVPYLHRVNDACGFVLPWKLKANGMFVAVLKKS